jgi:hypothetical protein
MIDHPSSTLSHRFIHSLLHPSITTIHYQYLCLLLSSIHRHRRDGIITIFIMQRHSFNALNSTFFVDSEYQFVKELGQGAYGCVVSAKHRRTGEGCAIKKITNINTKVCAPCVMIIITAGDR